MLFLFLILKLFQSYQSAQKQKWEHIKADWRQEKLKLLNALIGPSQNWIDIQKIPEQTILNETSGSRSCLNHIVSQVKLNIPNNLYKFIQLGNGICT